MPVDCEQNTHSRIHVELTVRKREVVGDHCDRTCREVVAVYLVAQSGRGAEVLKISIESVCEVKVAIAGIDDQVVE